MKKFLTTNQNGYIIQTTETVREQQEKSKTVNLQQKEVHL